MTIPSFLNAVKNHDYHLNKTELEADHTPATPVRTYSEPKNSKVSAMHEVIGKNFILPAAGSDQTRIRQRFIEKIESKVDKGKYAVLRFSVEVNGHLIDAMLLGKPDNINNGRWILQSGHNMDSLESSAAYPFEINRRINNLNANYLLFNYPGVGCSEGAPTQEDLVATYHAMLKVLEEDVKAKEIIPWGVCLGGGVQGEAIKDYEFKKDIAYVFVKDQTFSSVDAAPLGMLSEWKNNSVAEMRLAGKILPDKILGPLAKNVCKAGGWTLESVSSSTRLDKLNIPEVIIQNAITENPHHKKEIIGDGMISVRAALASKLIEQNWKCKEFIGIKTEHTKLYSEEEEKRIDTAILKQLDRANSQVIRQTYVPPPWKISNGKPKSGHRTDKISKHRHHHHHKDKAITQAVGDRMKSHKSNKARTKEKPQVKA